MPFLFIIEFLFPIDFVIISNYSLKIWKKYFQSVKLIFEWTNLFCSSNFNNWRKKNIFFPCGIKKKSHTPMYFYFSKQIVMKTHYLTNKLVFSEKKKCLFVRGKDIKSPWFSDVCLFCYILYQSDWNSLSASYVRLFFSFQFFLANYFWNNSFLLLLFCYCMY